MTLNNRLQRTVIPDLWRAAIASIQFAHAARWKALRTAAELRR